VSANPVMGVSETVGGVRSCVASVDVVSLHAATPREINAATTATARPRRRPPVRSLYIRVTFNGWLVVSDSTRRRGSQPRRR
jgi:hypothetical protein